MFLFFIEDENDSDAEEDDNEKDTVSSVDRRISLSDSNRASELEKIQQKSSLSSKKVLLKSSTDSVFIVCQTCRESNASVDSSREGDIYLHKPMLHISKSDEFDQQVKETAL